MQEASFGGIGGRVAAKRREILVYKKLPAARIIVVLELFYRQGKRLISQSLTCTTVLLCPFCGRVSQAWQGKRHQMSSNVGESARRTEEANVGSIAGASNKEVQSMYIRTLALYAQQSWWCIRKPAHTLLLGSRSHLLDQS